MDDSAAVDEAMADESATQTTEPEDADPGESNDDGDESAETEREDNEQEDTASDADGDDELDDAEDAQSEPDDALLARNRGRFITSPDRTAWYATPLDRDAIADARYPQIAGELESAPEPSAEGSSSDDDGEGSSSDSEDDDSDSDDGDEQRATDEGDDDAETANADESTVYAAPPANSPDSPEAVRQSTVDGSDGAGLEASSDANGDVEPDHLDTATASDSDPTPEADADGGEFTFSEEVTGDTDAKNERRDGDGDDDEEGADVDTADSDATDSDAAFQTERDSSLETPAHRESGDLDEASDDGGIEVVGDGPNDLDELNGADEPDETEDSDAPDDAAAAFDPFDPADHVDTVEDDIEEIPVDRALKTLNEEKPDLSLSSHGFEVSAEETDDGAVLTYTFDPKTVSITGSTKRLLTYQLQSFADQESTPDGDVPIDGQRIVIDVPDADGAAIQRWGQGAVSIIDRTLYLSDNGN
ncbi:hypothetical protein [Natronosalvus rutilus]|uniref:Uncharacterized protein n=1 Tax=Natronosalvus rutilus TaxID=2953753 RepID=A0A9E7NCR9_9EURY|nr:hypothetical protein [Natronosalvus rutilus]UTF55111.1 hypothetical protein NGM29_07635 [Natronosalvus rutilus]